jgi:hypothetical protein
MNTVIKYMKKLSTFFVQRRPQLHLPSTLYEEHIAHAHSQNYRYYRNDFKIWKAVLLEHGVQ